MNVQRAYYGSDKIHSYAQFEEEVLFLLLLRNLLLEVLATCALYPLAVLAETLLPLVNNLEERRRLLDEELRLAALVRSAIPAHGYNIPMVRIILQRGLVSKQHDQGPKKGAE